MFTIIKYTIISIIFITSIHYIYIYLMDNLTIPKTRDLINRPKKEYDDLYNTINSKTNNNINMDKDNNDMKNELKDYFKKLSNNKQSIQSINNINNFTTY